MTPAMFFVIGLLGYAVVQAFITSLHRVQIIYLDEPFVGLNNYLELFKDPSFHYSLIRTVIFVAASVGLGTLIAIIFSLCLYHVRRFSNIFRGISLIPYLVSGVAGGIMWRFVFSGSAGLINMVLKTYGFTGDISWLGHPNRALLAIILANVWRITPFSTLILLAGLQSINSEILDAANVDGATGFKNFFYIKLPLILPMMSVSTIWLNFASFNTIDVILPMTGGGPGRATELLAVNLYKMAFKHLNFSSASAMMIILLIINVSVSVITLKKLKI